MRIAQECGGLEWMTAKESGKLEWMKAKECGGLEWMKAKECGASGSGSIGDFECRCRIRAHEVRKTTFELLYHLSSADKQGRPMMRPQTMKVEWRN